MRTCPNCSAEFSENEVFCPVCGQEVQLVPDFITVESQYHQAQKESEKARRLEAEEREREAQVQKRIRQRRRHIILAIALAVAALLAGLGISHAITVNRQNQSYSYQMEAAENALAEKQYAEAESHILRALELQKDDRDALYLAAQIYLASGKEEQAEEMLTTLLSAHPQDLEAYELLFSLYLQQGRTDEIQSILMHCQEPSVLSHFASYLPTAPQFLPEEGTYNTDQEILLQAEEDGEIRYTTDGSEPHATSTLYTGPFTITEGITTIKAILITPDGFQSPVSAAIYQIQYDAPPAPVIMPDSGTYTVTRRVQSTSVSNAAGEDDADEEEDLPRITVQYPRGYICHYAFDKKPTLQSPVYSGPIEMQRGEHIFYAVLESETGKLGTIASATYIFEIRIVTPAPTPTPRPQYVRPAATETPTETPTPTPETEDQETTPTPEGDASSEEQQNENPSTNTDPTPDAATDTPSSGETGGEDSAGGGETPASDPAPANTDGSENSDSPAAEGT